MQLTPFARFYAVTLLLSLAVQFPLAVLGLLDAGTAPYAHGLIVAALCLAPWTAARLVRDPAAPETRSRTAPPSILLLLLLACAASAIALAGHAVAVATGWSDIDWTLHTLMIEMGRPEQYGLTELPSPWTLFAAYFALSLAVGGAIAGLLCHAVITAWLRHGLPAFGRFGTIAGAMLCGAAAALAWTPLAIGTAPTVVEGLGAAVRLIAFAAVMALLAVAMRRRSGNVALASASVGFAVIAGSASWIYLFPDAPSAVAGPAGIVHIGLWAVAAMAHYYVPMPKLVRRAVPSKPRTKADLLASRPAAMPAVAVAEPETAIEESPVKPVPNRTKTPREESKRRPAPKTKTVAKRPPAKKKSAAAAPKKKAAARKPKSR